MQLGEASAGSLNNDDAGVGLAELPKMDWQSRVSALMRKAQVLRHSDIEAYVALRATARCAVV